MAVWPSWYGSKRFQGIMTRGWYSTLPCTMPQHGWTLFLTLHGRRHCCCSAPARIHSAGACMAAVGFDTRDLPNPTSASTSSQGQSCLLCPHHVPLSIHDPCICVHGQAARATHHYPLMIHSWEITMIIVYDNIS